jgi:uncharacterized protein (TIGR02680 family)
VSRYRLHRAGILNVWQYDDQVFDLGDGRMLLRGTNGAGKSKTLELLLPYCLDGDNNRMNASGTSNQLMWLMFDGYDDTVRTGYLWVELALHRDDGADEHITCGIGLRGSQSAKSVKKWMFTTSLRVGIDLSLEGPGGPLSEGGLTEALGADGQVFTTVRDYRAHVGRRLFGLDPARYDDLLRLLYWLRRPQVGEEIEPRRIAEQLAQSLPEIDPEEVERAGATLDELAEHGERLERTRAARDAVAAAVRTYRRYARQVVRHRAQVLVDAADQDRRLARAVRAEHARLEQLNAGLEQARSERSAQVDRLAAGRAELDALATTPEEARLDDLRVLAEQAQAATERHRSTIRSAEIALASARSSGERLRTAAVEQARERDGEATELARSAQELSLALPQGFASAGAAERAVSGDDPVAAVAGWLATHDVAVGVLDVAVTSRRAVVEQVRGLAREHADLAADSDGATTFAEELAARADGQRARHGEARAAAVTEAQTWLDRVGKWATAPAALPLAAVARALDTSAATLADSDGATDLVSEVAVDAKPEQERRRAEVAAAQLTHERLGQQRDALKAELGEVRAERDPAPPRPVLPRHRDETPLQGMPFWRAVDFRDDVAASDRAAIEAALQQSGLLDGWLDPDGTVLTEGHDEVLLVSGAPVAGESLATVLEPDDAAPYAAAVLAAIALRPSAQAGEEPVAVGRDGTFRLGPVAGRASKPTAQYVGAAAREAERARRVADLTERITQLDTEIEAAATRLAATQTAVADFDAWVRTVPVTRDLDLARASYVAAESELRRLDAESAIAEQRATALRSRAALAHRAVSDAGSEHGLPIEVESLEVLLRHLVVVGQVLTHHRNRLAGLTKRASDVAEAVERTGVAAQVLAEAERELGALLTAATSAQAAYDALSAALSDTLEQLQQRRTQARHAVGDATAREKALSETVEELTGELGGARERAEEVTSKHDRHADVLGGSVAAVATLREVRGLLTAATSDLGEAVARALAAGEQAELVTVAREWAGWEAEDLDDNTLIRVADELKAGPAASYEPSLVSEHDAYAMLAEHQSQTVPLVDLDDVLTEKVAQDEQLLTERERRTFEEVLLGDLGDQLRTRLQESQELVSSMNDLLTDVRTSQGIKVKLRWRMRDDVPTEAREVATLVARTGSALNPDERERLATAMSRLVALAADDAPEDGYQVHLQRALDYRTWHEFRVQYARPGADWQDLGRRSPLSQGEQKVACYLPLFAAAAAHFTSVAGAAPHAPRFVLLDDAFPKIDARTHPVLFGLLVDLDLDFVITSERLWGDHPQVPRLEIYEALRNPGEPGIAHAHYTWNGRTLQSVSP